jgi:acyl carrier protein
MQRTQIRDTLQQIIESELDISLGELREDMVLAKEFSLDSMDYVSLVMRVEERFRIRLTNGDLTAASTVADLVGLVESKVAASDLVQNVRRAA